MKRRDFVRTSVGAGFVLAIPHRNLLTRSQARASRGTMFDKIWNAHVIADLGGDDYLLQVDRCIGGDPNQIRRMLSQGVQIAHPELFFNVPDHSVSTDPSRYTDPELRTISDDYNEEADDLRAMGFNIWGQFDPRFGIQHVIGPETGLSQPGMLLCAGDSHTCTHGAMGLISWGGEDTDLVIRTGTVIRHRPMTMRVNVVGTMGRGVRAKDVILKIIGQLGTDGGNGYAVEYAGPVVRALPQESRFSVCNLAIEMASLTGMVAPDDTTYEYLAGREFAPSEQYWDQAVAQWRTLPTDADARFDREETVDMSGVEPQRSEEHTSELQSQSNLVCR